MIVLILNTSPFENILYGKELKRHLDGLFGALSGHPEQPDHDTCPPQLVLTAEVSEFSLAISFLIDGTVVRVGSVGPAISCPELKAPSPWFNTSAPIFKLLAGRFGWLE